MDNRSGIFISVASYRDPELIPTLKNMAESASDPQRLHVAVCWQDDEDLSVFTDAGFTHTQTTHDNGRVTAFYHYNGMRIDVISVHYYTSQGACWARHLAETLYGGEAYFLQIDSHCRFAENWDSETIAMWQQLLPQSEKPVLSAYPPPYTPGKEEKRQFYVSRMLFREFVTDGFPMLTSATMKEDAPARGSYLAGGFIFASGSFLQEVPNDPQVFFSGEEIAMAVRAFTHGYDIYHPHKPLLWHYYQRKECNKVWGDHSNDAKKEGAVEQAWWERDKISKTRVRTVLGVEETSPADLGRYICGTRRSIRQFEHQAGICFSAKTVLPEVVGPDHVCYFATPPEDEAAWLNKQITYNKKVLKIGKADFDDTAPDLDHLHIGIYSPQNTLLYKKTVTLEEINKLRAANNEENGEFSVNLEFNTAPQVRPASIRLCPWLNDSGWGSVTEKTW